MTVTSTTSASATTNSSSVAKTTLSSLNQGDFMKLMLTQMQQQDPFNPVDQKEMLAQMAQFSSLAGTTQMSDTLTAISSKLDTLVTAQSKTNDAITSLAQKVAASQPADGTAAA
jgi:flagellar basal-body rod modification protein FlgD